MNPRAVVVLAAICLLAGCAPTSAPSASCVDALAATETASDEQLGELLAWSSDTCRTADAWLNALEQHPTGLGFESGQVDEVEAFTLLCTYADERSPVCEDAAATGRIDLSTR